MVREINVICRLSSLTCSAAGKLFLSLSLEIGRHLRFDWIDLTCGSFERSPKATRLIYAEMQERPSRLVCTILISFAVRPVYPEWREKSESFCSEECCCVEALANQEVVELDERNTLKYKTREASGCGNRWWSACMWTKATRERSYLLRRSVNI